MLKVTDLMLRCRITLDQIYSDARYCVANGTGNAQAVRHHDLLVGRDMVENYSCCAVMKLRQRFRLHLRRSAIVR